jgi:hypothetical protein
MQSYEHLGAIIVPRCSLPTEALSLCSVLYKQVGLVRGLDGKQKALASLLGLRAPLRPKGCD